MSSELRAQVRLAAPLAIQQVGLQLMGAVDLALLGRYDSAALGAAGVTNALVFAISCVGMGILLGLDGLVPQALGAGEPGRARALLRGGLRLAVIASAPAMALLLVAPEVLSFAEVATDVADEARIYTWARAFGVLPFFVQIALRSYLSAHGRTRPLVIAVVAGNLLNLVADYVLIFGDSGLVALGLPALGIPAMGVLGAALATSAVQLLTVVVFALSVRALHADRPPREDISSDGAMAILRIGVPIGLMIFAEVLVFAAAGVLAAHFSKTAAAAHSVALQLASFSFSLATGIGAATAIRVGAAVGAGDHQQARRAGRVGLALGVVVMLVAAAVFLLAAEPLASLFATDAVVIAAAIPLIQIAAVFQLADGAQAVAAGALRGAGDTRAAFWANVAGHYGVGLGISLTLAFGFGHGAPGLWWGLSAGLLVTALVLVGRFWHISARPIARFRLE